MIRRKRRVIFHSRHQRKRWQVALRFLAVAIVAWSCLSFFGFFLYLDLEVSHGVNGYGFGSFGAIVGFLFQAVFLVFFSCLTGIILSLPTLIALALATPPRIVTGMVMTTRLRLFLMFRRTTLPLLFVGTHLAFLLIGLGASPNVSRQMFGEGHPLSLVSGIVYEVFFSELSIDHSSDWQAAFASAEKPTLFMVLVPSGVLATGTGLSRTEAEFSHQSNVVLDGPELLGQLHQMATGEPALNPAVSQAEQYQRLAHLFRDERLEWFLAPDLLHLLQAPQREIEDSISKADFLGLRLALSQPQLLLLLRWGFLDGFLAGHTWQSLMINDETQIVRFLHRGRATSVTSRVRLVQLSELEQSVARLVPQGVRLEQRAEAGSWERRLESVDLMLARGVALLKRNPLVSIAIIPYANHGDRNPFGKALIHLSDKSPWSLPQKQWLTTLDIHDLVEAFLVEPTKAVAYDAPLRCVPRRFHTGMFGSNEFLAYRAVREQAEASFAEDSGQVLYIPSALSRFSARFFRVGLLCRRITPDSADSDWFTVVWQPSDRHGTDTWSGLDALLAGRRESDGLTLGATFFAKIDTAKFASPFPFSLAMPSGDSRKRGYKVKDVSLDTPKSFSWEGRVRALRFAFNVRSGYGLEPISDDEMKDLFRGDAARVVREALIVAVVGSNEER